MRTPFPRKRGGGGRATGGSGGHATRGGRGGITGRCEGLRHAETGRCANLGWAQTGERPEKGGKRVVGRTRCKASPSVGLETIHIWHSCYWIGPPTILDLDSHNVTPLYLFIDCSSHLALTPHTHTHSLSLLTLF